MNLSFLRPHARHRKRIAAYVDGSLRAAARAEFARHVGGCNACARDVETTVALRAALRRLPDPVAPRSFRLSPIMVGELRAVPLATPYRPRGRAVVGARFTAAAAAAALAAVIIIDVIPNRGSDGPTTAASAERDLGRLSATDKAAGGAAPSQATAAATAAPRAVSAPSADTGAISGAGAEFASSPTAMAVQDSTGNAVAAPIVPAATDAFAAEVEVPAAGTSGGWWTRLRLLQGALLVALTAALGAMVYLRMRETRARP